MAQTIISSYFHIVFSTKNRYPFIQPDVETELHAYIGGIVNNNNSKLLAANGTPDHIHLLVSMNKNITLPILIGSLKRASSKWIKTKEIKYSKFEWQTGYSAFSVGYKQLNAVIKYIDNQKEHHKKTLFKDELIRFYSEYNINYNKEYVWD